MNLSTTKSNTLTTSLWTSVSPTKERLFRFTIMKRITLKKLFLILIPLLSTSAFSQVNIKDTFELYYGKYNAGLISMEALNDTLSGFFNSLPYDEPVSHYEKVFKRDMYFWKDRTFVNDSGLAVQDQYIRSMLEYLETPVCPNGDEASWTYSFDPSPGNTGTEHYAGIITAIYMNPNDKDIILAGSGASGLWRTTNGGEYWECVTDHFGLPGLGINAIIDISKPSEPEGKYLLAATGKEKFWDHYGVGVLKSDDYGATWTRHSLPEVGGYIPYLLTISKPQGETNLVYALAYENVFVSTDRGLSWSLMAEQPALPGHEHFFSMEALSVTDGRIFVTSKKRWSIGPGHVWRFDPSLTIWEDLTDSVTAAFVTEFGDLGFYQLDEFEDNFGDYITYPGICGGVATSIEFETYDGDRQLLINPALTAPPPGETSPGICGGQPFMRLSTSTEQYQNAGYTKISFDGEIPEGARVEIWFDFMVIHTFTETDGYEYDITQEFEDLAILDLADLALSANIYVYFKFESGVYDTEAALPIRMDNLEFILEREGEIVETYGFGVSNSENDEIVIMAGTSYSLAETIDPKLLFMRSSDAGDTWTGSGRLNDMSLPTRLCMTSGYGSEEALYYGNQWFRRLRENGKSFQLIYTPHMDVRDIQIVESVDSVNHIIIGDDGGVSYSDDGGSSWTSLNGEHLPITQFYGFGISQQDHKTMVGGTQDNSSFIGAGEDWDHIHSGDGGQSDFSPSSVYPNTYYTFGNKELKVVGGPYPYTFVLSEDPPNNMDWFLGQPAEFDPIEGLTIFVGYAKGGDYRATIVRNDIDYNESGDDTEDDFLIYDFGGVSSEIGAIEICRANTNWIYAAEGENLQGTEYNKLYLSTNYGESFTEISSNETALYNNNGINVSPGYKLKDVLMNKNINTIVSDPDYAQRIWIGMSGIHVVDGETVSGEYRVLYTDNGTSWYDYSEGLPPFPINDLIYQEGTNDRLFAATDVGVFYRDAGMSEWMCFQEGLPALMVTELVIDYCTQTLYASTFGRGIWKTAIDLPDSEPLIIDENLSWGGVQQFEHDIIIESGNTLTLTGTIEMAGTKHIIVEPGARLKVDGGTITSTCDAFWGGVIVQGDFTLTQNAANQGVVTLLNGATIEHAEVGVALWQPGDWTSTGGIIYASASTFKNNRKDVEFIHYTNHNEYTVLPNVSYLTNMTFTWTDDFKAEFPLGHVTLYRVDGIKFTACHFKDERTTPTSRYYVDYAKNNSGIYSIDAHYFVLPACSDLGGCTGNLEDDPNWQPTTFENLDFGIYASNISTEFSVVVDRSVFENNLYGLQTVNVNNPVITRNTFGFNNDTTNNFTAYTQRGVHLVRSSGINVQENSFINDGAANGLQGIVCSDLGESEELIYKNTFDDLSYGIVTQGKNRGEAPTGEPLGLQFICDSNSTNNKDHLVLGTLWGGSPGSLYGVKAFNGVEVEPSGTVFSTDDPFPTGIHYTNESSNEIRYFYDSTVFNQKPVDFGYIIPIGVDFENACPSKLSTSEIQEHSSGYLTTTLSDFNTYSADLDTVLTNYTNLVNGGDTDALLTIIAGLTVSNRDTVHALLISLSPYLTEEVVRATLNHPITKYPHVWSYELVEANIEVAYKPGFMEFLETKTYPLEPAMRADIQALVDSNASTDMLAKQLEIAYLQSKKANAANILLQSLKNDTTGVDIDSVRHWIEVKGDVLAQTRVIDAWLQAGNYSAAQGALTALNADIQNYPAHLQDELTDYVSFKDKLIDLLEAGIPLDSLSETDYNFMSDLAENGEGLARYQAQELLCFFYDDCAEYPVITITTSSMAPLFQDKDTEQSRSDRSFKIYPNPAQTWVAIELPVVDTPLLITVVDLSGRLVYQKQVGGINGTDRLSAIEIWDTRLIGEGVYLITIDDPSTGESYGTQRVVIQH